MMAALAKAVISFVASVVSALVSRLPMSPFLALEQNPMASEWARTIGFFFPVSQIITHTTLFLGAVAVWIGLRWLFRILRAIG